MKALLKKIEEQGMNALVTFETSLKEVPEFPQGFLDVQVKKWKEPRSREALNYMWQLVTELAWELGEDKNYIYTECVNNYGVLEKDEQNQLIEIPIKEGIDPSEICGDGLYLHQTGYSIKDGNTKYYIYFKVKRPSEYDSKEFARLTDGIKRELEELRCNP